MTRLTPLACFVFFVSSWLIPSAAFCFVESFTDTVFPPAGWTVVNADSGVRNWQRFDIAYRSSPACAYCGWESYYLRNNDWLITPQCSVAVGDSLSFWYRAQDPEQRESLEVRISRTSPRTPDFELLEAVGTNSVSYQRLRLDLSAYAGSRVFLSMVYRSYNQYGLMLDDVAGPSVWNATHDAGVTRIVSPGRYTRVGKAFAPSCWIRNQGQVAEWIQASCEVRGFWREVSGAALAPGESALVSFPELALWQPDTYELVFATLLGSDQCNWNDSVNTSLAVYPFQSRGGPDSLRYAWFDSDDPAGPTFDWQELYASGTLLGWGDDSLYRLDLPWQFPFYGQSYSTIMVCTNGWLAFGPPAPGNPTPENQPIPSYYNPNRLVAPYWDDLFVKGNEGGIWYQHFGDTLLVIEWWHTRRKSCTQASLNFEVKLRNNGTIEFHYAGTDCGDARYDGGASATVGIENAQGTVGLQYLYDGFPPGNLLSTGRAIRFMPLPPGVEERPGKEVYGRNLPTIVRGVLWIPSGMLHAESKPILLNASGQMVQSLEYGRNDVSELPAGIYFVRLDTDDASVTEKVVLSR